MTGWFSEFFGALDFLVTFLAMKKVTPKPHAQCATKSLSPSIPRQDQSDWHTKCYIFDAHRFITKSKPREHSHLPDRFLYTAEYQPLPPLSQGRSGCHQGVDPRCQLRWMVQTDRTEACLCTLVTLPNRQYIYLLRDGGGPGQVLWQA